MARRRLVLVQTGQKQRLISLLIILVTLKFDLEQWLQGGIVVTSPSIVSGCFLMVAMKALRMKVIQSLIKPVMVLTTGSVQAITMALQTCLIV